MQRLFLIKLQKSDDISLFETSNMQWQSRPGGGAAHPFQHHRQHPANSNITRIPPTESYSGGKPKNTHVQGSRFNLFQV